MPRYDVVLFDFDHTLFDSDASQAGAYDATARAVGLDDPDRWFPLFDRLNRELWRAVERHEITPNEVRHLRFERFVAEAGIDSDPGELAELYVEALGAHGELYDGVLDLVDRLAPDVRLAVVTNGLGDVQRPRLQRTGLAERLDAVVVSGEVGTAKPGAAIFDLVFAALGEPDRRRALMVGDSLGSDVQGGINAGIDTCWLAPLDAEPAPEASRPTHRISRLDELSRLVPTEVREG